MNNLIANLTNPAIDTQVGVMISSQDSVSKVQLFLNTLISTAFGLAGVTIFILLIKGGYGYITSGGDKESMQKAVKSMTSAFIGGIILFSTYAILSLIEVLFGITLIQIRLIPLLQ